MALVVEDGTGLADAESYLSAVDFRAYCQRMGYDLGTTSDEVIEQRLFQATRYIDTTRRYKGRREMGEMQALEFPRASLTDASGITITGLPRRVVFACGELAFRAISERLWQDLDRGGRVTSEAVGPISVSYAPDAPAGKVFMSAMQELEPFFYTTTRMDGPTLAQPGSPSFAMALHDFPGTGLDPATE